jgi:hypothetical protein
LQENLCGFDHQKLLTAMPEYHLSIKNSLSLKGLSLLLILALLPPALSKAQVETYVQGTVRNGNGQRIPSVNIRIVNEFFGTMTNDSGFYRLKIPAYKHLIFQYSCIGYQSAVQSVQVNPGQRATVDVVLPLIIQTMPEVSISSDIDRVSSLTRINIKDYDQLPNPSGNFESLIKTLPGVSSSNELSSQYSVRGGNFDENLVYVNDVEIVRPFLIRSGQQEGLSFINADMVQSVKFSAGGFEARYGDKMSSVLDVTYRKPTENHAFAVNYGLLGGGVTAEGLSTNGRFSHITGVRYKSSRYLLNTLDDKGSYNPSFFDIQSLIAYQPNKTIDFNFLGNFARNDYQFIPQSRNTTFGTIQQVYNLKIYYDGQEVDRYRSALGSLTMNYHPANNLLLKFITSGYSSYEQETFDIDGQYSISELDNTAGSTTNNDSLLNLGVGGMLNHGRNFVWANSWTTSHIGSIILYRNLIRWSVEYKLQSIEDKLNEWSIIDSAGYMAPYSPTSINVSDYANAHNKILTSRITGFLQDTWQFDALKSKCTLSGGMRFGYWDYNRELVFSPRFRLTVMPDWTHDVVFHFATGVYYQPPVYKEMRDFQGVLNPNIKSQRSIHLVAGSDYNLTMWDRPFKFTTEVYYKFLSNLIPYKVDNMRIQYTAQNNAVGFAKGIDMKLNGEFVPGMESWASLSVMNTMENITNDFYIDASGKRVEPGYYPRPTDQRVMFSMFFQDYLPTNPTLQVHTTLVYGSPTQTSSPYSKRFDQTFPIGPYQRVDIGFSKILRKEGKVDNITMFHKLREFIVSVEIFNLLDISNTASYLWIRTVSNQENVPNVFGVPNYLTSRRLNVKASMKF